MGHDAKNVMIRSYDEQKDRDRIEDLGRRCEVGPAEGVILFTDTMGDPICRIRNSPMYNMLVAELGNELVGVIQGSIKKAAIHKPPNDIAKLGYVLGLRIAPLHRRNGIGTILVQKLEEWFIENDVDYAYMATETENEASVNLFTKKLNYVKFRTPSILVNPVKNRPLRTSSKTEIMKLKIEEAELLYRKFKFSTEFFPDDIGSILRNKLSLGTWVAYPRDEQWRRGIIPKNWAMLSVWNSGELFKLRLKTAPLSCLIYTKCSRRMDQMFPCLKLFVVPEFVDRFGFYFMYGLHNEGPQSGKLVQSLCRFVHNIAVKRKDECKVIVTEVGGIDTTLKLHIPHWKSLSCPVDLWCIKAMKNDDINNCLFRELIETTTKSLFVDPREV